MSKSSVSVAEYLKQQIAMSDKSQKQIANEAGFDQPNNVSMIKNGVTKLPISRIPKIALSLGIDPLFLLRITLSEYTPDIWELIDSILGDRLITSSEADLLDVTRRASVGVELDYRKSEISEAIEKVITKFADKERASRQSIANMPTQRGPRTNKTVAVKK